MTVRFFIFLFSLFLLFSSASSAKETVSPWYSGLSVSGGFGAFTGYNVQLGYRPVYPGAPSFFKHFGLRADMNDIAHFHPPFVIWNGQFTVNIRNIPVDFDLSKQTVYLTHSSFGALVDYYPWLDGFRVSGGLYASKTKLKGYRDFTKVNSAAAAMYWDWRLSPYLGIGYDWRFWKGLGLTADLGFMYIGSPNTLLDFTGIPGLTPADTAEINRKFEDKVGFIQLYPMIRLGLSWTF